MRRCRQNFSKTFVFSETLFSSKNLAGRSCTFYKPKPKVCFKKDLSTGKWSGFQIGSEIRKPNHLKSVKMATILSQIIWNPDKNVQILNGLVFKWFGLAKAWPSKSPDFKCFQISNGRISDPQCILNFDFRRKFKNALRRFASWAHCRRMRSASTRTWLTSSCTSSWRRPSQSWRSTVTSTRRLWTRWNILQSQFIFIYL